jgi:hypothetical protein
MIGKKLIERGTLPPGAIDEIVANPRLFTLVTKRIAAEVDGAPLDIPLSFWRRYAHAFGGVAVFLIAVIAAAAFLLPKTANNTTRQVKVPDAVPDVVRPVGPPEGTAIIRSTGRTFDPEVRVEKAVVRYTPKKVIKNTQPPVSQEPEGAFYAISTAFDLEETAVGGRIIRVDVPRSSLFALGVNIPLENGPEIVKADLLVGSDGVTRAIRIVN